jgi:subtilisin family serine protease
VRMAGALILVIALVLGAPAPGVAQAPASGASDVIVLFRDGVTPSERDRVMRQSGSVSTRHFRNVPASAGRADMRARAVLERHPDVLSVVPDRPVEKLGKPTSSGLATAAQVVPAGVTRIGAQPGALSVTGAGVGVAIVDTGIDFQHGDLAPVAAECFTTYATCQDDEGHGTHVAGIVAARNQSIDAIDVVGVAPDATLYAVKVLDRRGQGTDSTIMAGLDWIADHATLVSPPIRVVNMSLGRPGSLGDNPALHASVHAVTLAGLTVVVAAGNDSTMEVSEQVPATYPEVIAVASTTATAGTSACAGHPNPVLADTASFFTTDGAFDSTTGVGVSVSAPGEDREDISKSCFLKSVGILSTRLGGGTVRMSGTSMAAPHVTGVVALMAQQSPALTPNDARRRLRLGADALDTAPFDSPGAGYSFDGEREGVVSAPGALLAP